MGTYAPRTPVDIAWVLELHEWSVKRSVKGLVEKGIVKKRYVSGKPVGYEMVKHFGANEFCSQRSLV